MSPRILPPTLLAAVLTMAISPTRAAIITQELFDGIAGPPPGTDSTLDGKAGTSSSSGVSGTWTVNGSTDTIFTASNFNVNGNLPGLPSNDGATGGVWKAGGNNWGTNIYATIPLSNPISFANSQTIYFSVRLNNSGDTAMGVGLAAGSGGAAEFIGAGFSWNTATSIGGTTGDANNSAYISHGTLDAASGVYGIRAHEAAGSVNGLGLLVGRIIIQDGSPDLIDIARYAPDATIAADPGSASWVASSSYDTSMSASHLLLWINGAGTGELDAIRVGTDWASVTGVPEPSAFLLGSAGLLALLRRRR